MNMKHLSLRECSDQVVHVCRYPQDTMHDVAEKELQYVQGSMDSPKGTYTPSPGYTPDDGYIKDSDMSPEARSLIRSSSQPDVSS
jgi:hypothetical protein